MNDNRTWNNSVWMVLLIVVIAFPVFFKQSYVVYLLINIFLNVILGLSLYPVFRIGFISMGHGAFMAIGAYSSALLVMKLGLPFLAAMPLAGLIAAAIGILVCYPAFQVKWLSFVVITFGIAEVVRLIAKNWEFVGGVGGIAGIPAPKVALPGLPEVNFVGHPTYYYYLILCMLLITFVVINRVDKSRIGERARGIAENEALARSIGINASRYKVFIFAIACFFAGIGGSFYAHFYRFVGPGEFTVWKSIYMLMYVQVGGVGTIFGPIVGAIFLTVLPEIFRFASIYQPLIYGVILIITMMLLPEGLMGIRSAIASWRRRSAEGRMKRSRT